VQVKVEVEQVDCTRSGGKTHTKDCMRGVARFIYRRGRP
jgi:hypothetical protein